MRPTMNIAIYLYTHHAMVHRGYVGHVLAHEEQMYCSVQDVVEYDIIVNGTDKVRDRLN